MKVKEIRLLFPDRFDELELHDKFLEVVLNSYPELELDTKFGWEEDEDIRPNGSGIIFRDK